MRISQTCAFICLSFSLIFLNACKDDDGRKNCIPNYNITATINMVFPTYSDLQNPGGWAYVAGVGTGSRGLIVVNTGTSYKVYDRNAPHLCPAANTTLEVTDGGTTVSCQSDNSKWILYTGQPIQVANRPLITYMVQQQGSLLVIYN